MGRRPHMDTMENSLLLHEQREPAWRDPKPSKGELAHHSSGTPIHTPSLRWRLDTGHTIVSGEGAASIDVFRLFMNPFLSVVYLLLDCCCTLCLFKKSIFREEKRCPHTLL